MDFLIILILLTATATSLLWPLRRVRRAASTVARDADAEGLNAARDAQLREIRDAKLREIRDLELDFRLGKLSQSDFISLDAALRAEAVQLMRQVAEPSESGGSRRPRVEAA